MKKIITLIVSGLLFVGTIFAQEDTSKSTHSKSSGKESKKAANTKKTVKQETRVVKTKTTK